MAGDEARFQFGIIGDMPYSTAKEEEYRRVIAAINAADLVFVAHVGDAQGSPNDYYADPAGGTPPCSDEKYDALLRSFQAIGPAFVLTPGDNDWTDCHQIRDPKRDPLERLSKVRAMFYPDGRSLGQQPIAVISQSADPQFGKFRENLRWSVGGVTFGTLHIVGSNDNFARTAEMDAEHAERKAANLAWIRTLFAEAKATGSRGLVLITHANPGFESYWPPEPKARYFRPFVPRGQAIPSYPAPYRDYVAALAGELERFENPVVFFHGDTHLFRIDKPLYSAKTGQLFENFTRVETFGDPNTHWVRVVVDPAQRELFRFEPQIIAGNAARRQ